MLTDRLPAQQRYQLWSQLCLLADQLHDLTQQWWKEDTELVDIHYERWRMDNDQYELSLTAPDQADDGDDLDF